MRHFGETAYDELDLMNDTCDSSTILFVFLIVRHPFEICEGKGLLIKAVGSCRRAIYLAVFMSHFSEVAANKLGPSVFHFLAHRRRQPVGGAQAIVVLVGDYEKGAQTKLYLDGEKNIRIRY